jgi:hypothetical protein
MCPEKAWALVSRQMSARTVFPMASRAMAKATAMLKLAEQASTTRWIRVVMTQSNRRRRPFQDYAQSPSRRIFQR